METREMNRAGIQDRRLRLLPDLAVAGLSTPATSFKFTHREAPPGKATCTTCSLLGMIQRKSTCGTYRRSPLAITKQNGSNASARTNSRNCSISTGTLCATVRPVSTFRAQPFDTPSQQAQSSKNSTQNQNPCPDRRCSRCGSFNIDPQIGKLLNFDRAAERQHSALLWNGRANRGWCRHRRILLLNEPFRQAHQGGVVVGGICVNDFLRLLLRIIESFARSQVAGLGAVRF